MPTLGEPQYNVLCDTREEFDINDYWLHDGDDRDEWFAVGHLSFLPPHMCCSKCEYYTLHRKNWYMLASTS